MRTESAVNASDVRAWTSPRSAVGMSRAQNPGNPETARAALASRIALLGLLALTGVGCATSNYDFVASSKTGADSRVAQMSEAVTRKQELGEDGELYDVSVIPLVRTGLNVFEKSDDEDVPDGFVEADIDAYLPLFGFVDASVRRYDTDREMYESHEYDSYLWGLFRIYREQVDTEHGLREKEHRRFLWIFGWSSDPTYVELTGEGPSW